MDFLGLTTQQCPEFPQLRALILIMGFGKVFAGCKIKKFSKKIFRLLIVSRLSKCDNKKVFQN